MMFIVSVMGLSAEEKISILLSFAFLFSANYFFGHVNFWQIYSALFTLGLCAMIHSKNKISTKILHYQSISQTIVAQNIRTNFFYHTLSYKHLFFHQLDRHDTTLLAYHVLKSSRTFYTFQENLNYHTFLQISIYLHYNFTNQPSSITI